MVHLSQNKNQQNDLIIVEENSVESANLDDPLDAPQNPMLMISVNLNSELIYTTLYDDINAIDGMPTFKMEVVYSFEELINLSYIIDKFNLILFCGNSKLFLWNVEKKKIISVYKIKLGNEPWLIVWDAVFIDSKNTLIIGLSDGTVRQLFLDPYNLSFYKSRIYQSNDEGSPIYSVNYIPFLDKVFATNNNNTITEFSFFEEKHDFHNKNQTNDYSKNPMIPKTLEKIGSSKLMSDEFEKKNHTLTFDSLKSNSIHKK